MSLVTGRYVIKNVEYGTYVTTVRADEGTPLSETATANTENEQWNVIALGNGSYRISNVATGLHARTDPPALVGSIVVGSTQLEQWSILQTRVHGQFKIGYVDSQMFWTFEGPEEGTLVTLQENAVDLRGAWVFVPSN